MTVENDFLVWAAGGGNVASQAAYAAASQLPNGYVTGVAPSNLFNKSWRQSSIIAAMIASFIVEQAGQPAIDDGTTATLLTNFIAALGATGRIKLLAAANVYVNGSTGNDSTGAGTLALPWATIEHAVNVIRTGYDLAGQTMTINVAAGSYTAGAALGGPVVGAFGTGSLVIQGAGSGSTTISVSAANCFTATRGAGYTINGFTLVATGSGTTGNCVIAQSGGNITIGTDIIFGSAGTAHIAAQTGGLVDATSYTIGAGAAAHWDEAKGTIVVQGGAITLAGTPNFTGAFAVGQYGGLMEVAGETFTGAATGVRYLLTLNSVIYTAGGGGSYLPGNAGGSTATGAQYG
jgi:hypothetical protein